MKGEIFFLSVCILFLNINENLVGAKHSERKAEDLIDDICARLFEEDLQLQENQRWDKLCKRWVKSVERRREHRIQSESDIDELSARQNHQLRLIGSRSGSRSGTRRSIIRGGTRGGGSRLIPGGTRYRSRRNGAPIIRPPGSMWSRSRHSFLPISRRYYYRSRSSGTNRFTTPATGPTNYYYCSSNSSNSMEIQCSSATGDTQCCDDEAASTVYCCGSDASDELDDDFNQATKIVARVLYTLSILALLTHILMRRFQG